MSVREQEEFLAPEVYEGANGHVVICQEWPALQGEQYLRVMLTPEQAEALAHQILALLKRGIA